jgi:hypothetical protein
MTLLRADILLDGATEPGLLAGFLKVLQGFGKDKAFIEFKLFILCTDFDRENRGFSLLLIGSLARLV